MGTKVSINKDKVRKDHIGNTMNCYSQKNRREINEREVDMSEVNMSEVNMNDNSTNMGVQEKKNIEKSSTHETVDLGKKTNEGKRGHVCVSCAICRTDYALIEFKTSKICDDCIQYIKSTC